MDTWSEDTRPSGRRLRAGKDRPRVHGAQQPIPRLPALPGWYSGAQLRAEAGPAIAIEILIILALVLINGLLSGTEIAIISVRKTRLRELTEKGSGSAKSVERLRADPERFLATVQIGITVIGAAAGAFGGATIAARLTPLIVRIPGMEPYADDVSFGVVVAAISYLSLVLGELVPKSLALRSSEPYALLMGRPMLALSWIARPVVWLLTASSNVVLRLFGDRTSFTETRMSIEEIRAVVEDASESGSVDPRVGEIASRALAFSDLVARDAMVPRRDVIALPMNAPPDEIRRVLLEEGHSRIPVYEGTIDNIVGYISAKDVIALAWESQLIVLKDLVRPVRFVPETMRAVALLQEMQERRTHIAIVVDEVGGFSGILTMEDLVEELVGKIVSEHAEVPAPLVREEADGAFLVLGTAPIRDVNRETGLELPEGSSWTTVAGLCITLAGHIPAKGEKVTTAKGIALEVVEASPRSVGLLRVRPASAPQAT